VRVVAEADTRRLLRDRGAVFVWPRAVRCCGGRQWLLEASTERPDQEFELVHAVDGFQVWASTGLVQPEELHLTRDPKGRLHAYWNNQAWIG
jgi:hypothetical protein